MSSLPKAVQRLFRPARYPGRVGAEVELIPVTGEARPRPVDPAVLAAEFDSAFVREARPTFEPGGQLELSPAPRATVADLVRDVERLVGRAQAIAARCGARLEFAGTNPYHSLADVPLRTPKPRYLAMQQLFDAVGQDGRRMMRLTASLQVTVDLLPGRAGYEQWLVANLAGPPLAAAFANSPHLDGRPAAVDGARTRIWHGVDLARTGYDGRHLDFAALWREGPIGAYTAFAWAAPRFPIPESADPAYHLTTLFPPVRPRGGYLEIRYLDAQPVERIGAAISTLTTLLYDDRARRDALDLLLPRAGDMEGSWLAAAAGYSPVAGDLLAIASSDAPSLAGGLR